MDSLCEKTISQGVLMIGESRPIVLLFSSFHARGTPTIMVRTLITLEELSGANEAEARCSSH